MTLCDNGRRGLDREDCYTWRIPGTSPDRHLVMAPGPAGFLLAHLATYFHDTVERLDTGVWDDWGWAWRPIRGTEANPVLSNHAGWAMDLNATQHPMGVATTETFTPAQAARIRSRLRWMAGTIRWGGDYRTRPDAMHFEIVAGPRACTAVARMLRNTPRGRRVRALNPGGWR